MLLGNNFRYALRGLVRTPGYTAAFVLTLGLGIGANTAIQRLLEVGLVDNASIPDRGPATDQRRKYYRITELGRQVAALEGARLARMVDAAHQRRLLPERGAR